MGVGVPRLLFVSYFHYFYKEVNVYMLDEITSVTDIIDYSRMLAWPDELFPIGDYDYIDLNCSGGNDSTACILTMLHGYKVPKEKLRIVHMRVDGPPENETFFDWPQTEAHLQYLSDFFGIPLIIIHDSKGIMQRIEDRGKFMSSTSRFCTSYTKRDVYNKFARAQGDGVNILCVSGERAQESTRRSLLPVFCEHDASAPTKGRIVHWFRPIFHLTKDEVRGMMRRAGVDEHECYSYGMSRCSCKFCFFNSEHEMKIVAELFPEQWERLKALEKKISHTMKFSKGKPIPLCEFINEYAEYEEVQMVF